MGLISKFKKWLNEDDCKESTSSGSCEIFPKIDRNKMFDELDLGKYPQPELLDTYKEGKPSVLIVDDVADIKLIYIEDLEKLKVTTGVNIREELNIYFAMGRDSGFIAYKFLEEGTNVEYGLLDITMESTTKFDSGDLLDIDGVDIAVSMKKHNPNAKFLFVTAHSLKKGNKLMGYYIQKIEENFLKDNDLKIEDISVHKSTRMTKLAELFSEQLTRGE